MNGACRLCMRLHFSSGSNGVMTTMWSPAPIWIGLAPIVHVNLVNACEFFILQNNLQVKLY